MYRADQHGQLVEIVIINPNANERALAKQQQRELLAKLGKKRMARLDPEVREILVREKASLFSIGGGAAAREKPLQWDRVRLDSPILKNTDALAEVRGSKYPTTLPHYARIT